MVTAELAVGLPALVVVTAVAVTAVAAVVAQLRCQDAAAAAARMVARGQSSAVVTPLVRRDAPGSAIEFAATPTTVTVTVRTTVHPLGFLPAFTVAAAVTDPLEAAAGSLP